MPFQCNPNSIHGGYSGNSLKSMSGSMSGAPISYQHSNTTFTPSVSHSVSPGVGHTVGGGASVHHNLSNGSGVGGSFHSHGGSRSYSVHHDVNANTRIGANYETHRGGGQAFSVGAQFRF